MSQITNLRYSITLNDAQLDYLSDEQQDILRMKCLKTFIRMAVLEETKVSGKNYSALSVWFTPWGMKKSSFFNSKPVVKPLVKPSRTTKRVPPETAIETDKSDCANTANPGGTQ